MNHLLTIAHDYARAMTGIGIVILPMGWLAGDAISGRIHRWTVERAQRDSARRREMDRYHRAIVHEATGQPV